MKIKNELRSYPDVHSQWGVEDSEDIKFIMGILSLFTGLTYSKEKNGHIAEKPQAHGKIGQQ